MRPNRFSSQLQDLQQKSRYRALQLPGGLDLTSNDYLGFASHPRLKAKAIQWLDTHGDIGAAGSRLLRGHQAAHADLESTASDYFAAPKCLYMATGFQANMALLTTLCSRQDIIVYDELVHASTRDGIAASHAKSIKVQHNDVSAFEDAIKKAQAERRKGGMIWLVVETLYSMDGDIAHLPELYDLAERYDAYLIVDEAHASGVLGEKGRGLAADYSYDRIVSLHTCGKALGVAGALICANESVIDYLVNKARPFIYSTAPMPLQAYLVAEAIRLCASDEGGTRRSKLFELSKKAQQYFDGPGTHVVPIIIGTDEDAVHLTQYSKQNGFDIRAIRPPTVPEGTARLRLSLNADLDMLDLDRFGQILQEYNQEHAA